METVKELTVSVPMRATQRREGRTVTWTVEFAGMLAYGGTLAAARAAMAETIVRAANHARQPPAFARDDDGTLVVAVPDGIGTAEYRVSDGRARLTSHSVGTPAETVARVHHYTPLSTY